MLLNNDKDRARHMADAIAQILEYTRNRVRADLDTDLPLQHLVARNLEILGEAASRVSSKCRVAHPAIPWRDMIDLRNRLIHTYFDMNLDVIWDTIQRDLPSLLKQIESLRARLECD